MNTVKQLWDNMSAVLNVELRIPATAWKIRTIVAMYGTYYLYTHKGNAIIVFVVSGLRGVYRWLIGVIF